MRSVLLAAAWLTVGVALAAPSKPPAPTPAKAASQPEPNASANQAQAAPDKRATNEQPAVIELLKAPVIGVEATDKTEKHNDYASHEWWLVYLTGLLAVITGALALYTAKLYRATVNLGEDAGRTSVRQAKETADALQISRDSLELAREESKKQESQWFNSHMVWGDIARSSNHSATAAQRAVRTMRDTAFRQLRAYITVRLIRAEWAMDDNWHQHRVTIKVKLINEGQTPAKDVRSWVGFTSSAQEPTTFGEHPKTPAPSVYGPRAVNWISLEPTFMLGRDLVEQWRAGVEVCYVWGKVEYLDIFNEPRTTIFRYMMFKELLGDDSGVFTPCNDGNDYT